MPIIALALKEYFVNNGCIKKFITNHKDIYDFCIAKKFPKPWHGEYTELIDNQPVITTFKKNIRYYISTNGSYLWEINGDDGRRSQLSVGYRVIPFNKFEIKEEYNIDYNFYIKEANKIINTIDNGQLELF